MSEQPRCFGKDWPNCPADKFGDECSVYFGCQLSYQENVAIPRLNKEMSQAESAIVGKKEKVTE